MGNSGRLGSFGKTSGNVCYLQDNWGVDKMTGEDYIQKYLDLIEKFTGGDLSASEFSNRYIDLYLDDEKAPNEAVFRSLDYLFAEADAYCEPELRDEVRGSIDEEQLTEAAVKTAGELREIR